MKSDRILTPHLSSWAIAGFLPGLIGGAFFAASLFFLNVQLPFSAVVVGRSVAIFGLIGGLLSLLLHLPLSGARFVDPWRLLPWTLTLVLGGSALSLWVHASRFSFYLPPELDARLIRAALWVTILALVTFYTALLHTLQKDHYSLRSRTLIGACAFFSLVLTLERRAAFPVASPSPSRPILRPSREPPRLIVIGIESATLDAILPLTEQGRLPFFANLLQQGAYGRLAGFEPVDRIPLWTSLATGQYPYRHGVVSAEVRRAPFAGAEAEIHLLPVGFAMSTWASLLGMTPSGLPSSRSPSLWDIFERARLSTALVGWPAPRGSADQSDIVISDELFRGMPTDSDRRSGWADRALARELRPDTVDPAVFARFGDEPLLEVKEALAQDLWREAIAIEILAEGSTDVLFLYLPGLQEVSRRYFGAHVATQFEGRQDDRLDSAAQVVTEYYAHLDASIRRLWERIEGPKLLAVVSPWGADEAPTWRQLAVAISGRGPAVSGRFDHAPDGVLMLLGENLNSGTFLDDADVVDVAPTLLYGLGLPIASDLDGRVLTRSFGGTFLNRTPLTFVPAFPRQRRD